MSRPPHSSSRRPAPLRAALALLLAAAAAAAPAAGVQGYVSGRLLRTWCTGATRLDTEACLSYLRGVFDTLQAAPGAPAGDAICIPPEVAVTQLRSVTRRFAAAHPERLGDQAAVLLLEALRAEFPCPPPD